jgi:hypothetical protein
LPIVVETSNAEAPRRYVYHTPPSASTGTIGVRTHLWLYNKWRACINIPKGHLRCFVFDHDWNFLRISNRQNQSVVNAFIYVCPHPKLPANRPDSAWGQCKFIKVLAYGQCFWRKDVQL